MNKKAVYEHELSYKKKSIAQIVHKSRMKMIKRVLSNLEIPEKGTLADFGSSNGFIISELKNNGFKNKDWDFVGYDKNKELIEIAKAKRIKNANFYYLDMNDEQSTSVKYDVVTCFETIEHVGTWKTALSTLMRSCKENGYIIITFPNEIGIQGFMKYIGRKLVRRNPYPGMFNKNNKEFDYFKALCKGSNIEKFRDKNAVGYGPHLGFDYKTVFEYMKVDLLKRNNCSICSIIGSYFDFNILMIIKKN